MPQLAEQRARIPLRLPPPLHTARLHCGHGDGLQSGLRRGGYGLVEAGRVQRRSQCPRARLVLPLALALPHCIPLHVHEQSPVH